MTAPLSTDDARTRVDRAADDLAVPVPEAERAAAAELLRDLYAAAARHGVTPDDLAAVGSLPATAVSAVQLRRRHVDEHPAGAAGCDACRVLGPLLTAPGTSGRTWVCGGCGTSWTPPAA